MESNTTYADADEARDAYLNGELTEDELEDVLDDELMHEETGSDGDDWHDRLLEQLDTTGVSWKVGGVMMMMLLWITTGVVTLSLGESGAIAQDVADVGALLLGMMPIFPAAMLYLFIDMIRDAATEFRLVRQARYVLSIGGAAMVYTTPPPAAVDLTAEAVEIHGAMSLLAAVYVLAPALGMWVEDNEEVVERFSKRLQDVVNA